jgi:hypothetical protein
MELLLIHSLLYISTTEKQADVKNGQLLQNSGINRLQNNF